MSNNRFSIEVGPDMLPALIEALSHASTVAMMHFSETKRHAVQEGFKTLAEGLLAQMGILDVYKINVYKWFGAHQALKAAETYFFYHQTEWRSWSERDTPNLNPRRVSVVIDDVNFEIFQHQHLAYDAPEISVAESFLERACGMGTMRKPDVIEVSAYADWSKRQKEKVERG